jgi:DNA replication protein DnaC
MKKVNDILSAMGLSKPEPGRSMGGAAEPADVCPICKGIGFVLYDVPPDHPDYNRPMPCRCTSSRLTDERLRELRRFANLGALERMTFDSFAVDTLGVPEPVRDNLRSAYQRARDFANEPEGWLVLLGGYGSGKTHLAAAIANQALALGRRTLFLVVPDLLDYLRAAYAPTSATGLDERMETIRDVPLLILDDLGAHHSTPWAQEKLFQILNHRYNNRLPTVITSNLRLEEFDPRMTSRLADPDISQVWEIIAPDFRQTGAGKPQTSLNSLPAYGEYTFDAFINREGLPVEDRENLHRALSLARRYAEDPSGWLVLTGPYGSGKTHLAAAVANLQVTLNRAVPVFVVVPDLLDHLRATFSPNSPTTFDRLFEQVKGAGLLVLDDLSTDSATPWAREKLFQLLNHRYVSKLPTVITTADDIEKMDPRLASRMLDKSRCLLFAITAPSYRSSEIQRNSQSGGASKPRSRSSAHRP